MDFCAISPARGGGRGDAEEEGDGEEDIVVGMEVREGRARVRGDRGSGARKMREKEGKKGGEAGKCGKGVGLGVGGIGVPF